LFLYVIKHHTIKMDGGLEVQIHTVLTSAPDDEWSASCLGNFTNGERILNTDPRGSLDTVEKRKILAPARN
jgi:hypothetical protein